MEGMINRTVYTINPNFRLQSNHLLVEWIMIDTFTFQQELLQHESAFIYNKGKNQIICQRYGNSLHFIYAKITKWENRLLQKWLRGKLQEYIIDTANRVLPQRMHELEIQHCLYAKKVIVKKLRKNTLGLCYTDYKTIALSPRIILLPQRYLDSIILHEMAHLKFPHHRKTFWNFLTTLLGEDSKLQNDRMDAMMSTFYNYSEFLLK